MASLILALPSRNGTLRMRSWRALKESGAALLRDGVYVLPGGAPGAPVLERTAGEIRAAGGLAVTAELRLNDADAARVRELFDRSAEYEALVRKAASGPSASQLARLQRAFDKLAAIDFFPGKPKQQAAGALAALQAQAAEPRPSSRRVQLRERKAYQRRVWVTRKSPWVDRLASAWLIKRFIDREARFAWIASPRGKPKGAVGYDFDGAEFTHVGNRVTFEVLLASFGLEGDPALAAIGAAVHFLDVGGVPVADAKGLETVLRGAKENARNDDALLAEAMRVLDLFHSAYKAGGKA